MRGREVPETLGHVLGKCHLNKPSIIKRHDEIKHLVVAELEKGGYTLAVEQTFSMTRANLQERLKPDIIACRDGKLSFIDVTVRFEVTVWFEDGDTLEVAGSEKIAKYQPLLPRVMEVFNCREGTVVPIVVGARGAMPRATVKALRGLGIEGKGPLTTIAMIALRSSLEIGLRHLDN